MPEFTQAELLRSPLEATLLELLALGHADVRRFGWPQPPAEPRVAAALRSLQVRDHGPHCISASFTYDGGHFSLQTMGAIEVAPPESESAAAGGAAGGEAGAAGGAAGGEASGEAGGELARLTPLGAALAALPVDLPVGQLLLLGEMLEMRDALLSLAAIISVPSPLSRQPADADGRQRAASSARQEYVGEVGEVGEVNSLTQRGGPMTAGAFSDRFQT